MVPQPKLRGATGVIVVDDPANAPPRKVDAEVADILGRHYGQKTVSLGGPELATRLMIAQLPIGPRLMATRPNARLKPSSAERRRARIEAGRLQVVDGHLVGGYGTRNPTTADAIASRIIAR